MGDEKEGPFKVVQSIGTPRGGFQYSIVKQSKTDVFLQVVIPDAGLGETARTVCNLLNKNHRMLEENRLAYEAELEVTNDNEARGTDG
ncbi:hypothetical protein PBI_CAMILLE_68 [Microbacterium phage Camille]|nr:hypothetical protein PBI_CAMILLE_68 [Microbacterium phage Camille]